MTATGRSARSVVARGWQLGTSPVRAMPDFLILGAQKAGTTSMFEYLVSHPGVLAPTTKEVHYFSHRYGKSTLWYRSHFACRASLRRATTHLGYRALTGEASPYYLTRPLAAVRAHGAVPAASLVVLVRDPIDRAHSHWRMNRQLGTEPLGFAEAIAAEEDRLEGELGRIESGREFARAPHQQYSYVGRGRYADAIAPWTDRYGRERLLIVQAEQLFTEPGPVYEQVLAHLGLPPPDAPPAFLVHGGGSATEPIAPEIRAELRRSFTADNERLYELSGIDYR